MFCLKLDNLSVHLFEILCTLFCYNVTFILCIYFIRVKVAELVRYKIYLTNLV